MVPVNMVGNFHPLEVTWQPVIFFKKKFFNLFFLFFFFQFLNLKKKTLNVLLLFWISFAPNQNPNDNLSLKQNLKNFKFSQMKPKNQCSPPINYHQWPSGFGTFIFLHMRDSKTWLVVERGIECELFLIFSRGPCAVATKLSWIPLQALTDMLFSINPIVKKSTS